MRYCYLILVGISMVLGNPSQGQVNGLMLENLLLNSTEKSFDASFDNISAGLKAMSVADALATTDKLIDISTELPHYKIAFNKLLELAQEFYQKGKIGKQFLLYLLTIVEKPAFAKPEIQQTILSNIASYYYSIGDYDNSKYYLGKQLAIPITDIPARRINVLTTIGFIYREKQDYNLTLYYLQKALEQAKSENSEEWIGIANGNLGETYYIMGHYADAVPFLLTDINISLAHHLPESAAGSYATLGAVYLKKDDTKNAKKYLDSAIFLLDANAAQTRFSGMRSKAYRYLSEYYVQEEQFEEAEHFLKMAFNIKDSVNAARNKAGLDLQISEVNAAKNKQNALLLQTTIRSKKNSELAFTISIIAIVLILGFVFLLLKQKQRINAVLNEKNISVIKEKEAIEKREQDLAQSNEAKNKLFSIIAHDLRTPIGNLNGLLTLIDKGIIQKEALTEHLPGILAKVESLSDTIDNLLNWTYAQLDGISIDISDVNIWAQVNKVFDFLEPVASKKNISLKNITVQGTMVIADINQLEIVIRNLVSNAIKFSNENSAITVSSVAMDNKVTIAISDMGIGMSKETMERIFESNSTVSTAGTKGEKGVGLGLIICKEFVTNNKGAIWAEQNQPEGTVFKVELPCSK